MFTTWWLNDVIRHRLKNAKSLTRGDTHLDHTLSVYAGRGAKGDVVQDMEQIAAELGHVGAEVLATNAH